jgi:His/Glu/Gln/Arg/opine family amino acid ABC transporter permease subunit
LQAGFRRDQDAMVSSITFYVDGMLQGASVTAELTAIGTVVSLGAGVVGALGRLYGPSPVRQMIGAYVELVRGLPAILQLFIVYFGLSQFGINLSAMAAALIWMCLYGSGYAIEVFRAGLQAVPEGQYEASTALGLGHLEGFRRVILPQATAAMLPPLISFVILQVKNTTLVYFIGVQDIMYEANLGADNTDNALGLFLMAAAFYVVANVAIARVGAVLLERRVATWR